MKLAEGRPLPRRMMAAMAQQDCGQCGYNCKDYADALFAKKEKRLNLCVPGGKDTARMLKQLYQELGACDTPAAAPTPAPGAGVGARPLARQSGLRDIPVAPPSQQSRARTRKPGTSSSISPTAASTTRSATASAFSRPTTRRWWTRSLQALDAPPDFPIGGRTLREVLTDGVSLSPAPDMLFQLISYPHRRRPAAEGEGAGGRPGPGRRCRDPRRARRACRSFPASGPIRKRSSSRSIRLQPRVYSISSSLKCNPGRVSLTVDAVRYEVDKRTRLGVASTFLAGRVKPGDKIRVYVQKAQHFALPADPNKPIIMIGPGTGVAPFRAFLQERQATKAPGRNWLYLRPPAQRLRFLLRGRTQRRCAPPAMLTRLTLAWSRDADEKIYVQHRMRDGRPRPVGLAQRRRAHLCLRRRLAHGQGRRARADRRRRRARRAQPEDAARYVAELKKNGRYQADVY